MPVKSDPECTICQALADEDKIIALNAKVDDGESDESVLEILKQFGLDEINPIDVLYHMSNCKVTKDINLDEIDDEDAYTQMKKQVRVIQLIADMLQQDIVEGEYKRKDGDVDGTSLINQLTQLYREKRETLLAMQRIKSTNELTEALNDGIMVPLVNTVTTIAIDEFGRLLTELMDVGIPVQYHARMKKKVEEQLLRVGERFQEEILDDLASRVARVVEDL